MAAISPATVKVEIGYSGPTIPLEPGGFIGAGLEGGDWNGSHDSMVKGFTVSLGTSGTAGLRWEKALNAVMCAFEVQPRDIRLPEFTAMERELATEMFGHDPFEWDDRDRYDRRGRKLHTTTKRGFWREMAPDWNFFGYLGWRVETADPEEGWYLRSRDTIPANRPISLMLQRDATPNTGEEAPSGTYYSEVRFGGRWALRLTKWGRVMLRKLTRGAWTDVAAWDWDLSRFWRDGERALWVAVFPIDGKLLIKTNLGPEAYVYEEPAPVSTQEAGIAFCGNGGSAGFGLHEIRFDERTDNYLLANQESLLGYRPNAAPTPVIVGYVPSGATAEVLQQVAGGTPAAPGTAHTFRLALRLAPTAGGLESPAIRMVGLSYAPRMGLPVIDWQDVTDDFQSGNGTWEYDIERRRATSQATVTLDNAAGTYRTLRRAVVMRVSLGRTPDETVRYLAAAYLDDTNRENLSRTAGTFSTLDRVTALDDVKVGYRRPLDGMKACDALAEILTWGNVHPDEIGVLYDSGARLPSTVYASQSGTADTGVLLSGQAAVQFDPEATVGEAVRYVMQFDYNTMLWYDPQTGLFTYQQLEVETGPLMAFGQAESADWDNVLRRETGRRPRLREISTRFRVEGRNRRNDEKLIATAWDRTRVQDVEALGYRAHERDLNELDPALGETRLVKLRCRYLYDFHHRLREERPFSVEGRQDLFPPIKATITETAAGEAGTYYILGVAEDFDSEGEWQARVEAAAWAA